VVRYNLGCGSSNVAVLICVKSYE